MRALIAAILVFAAVPAGAAQVSVTDGGTLTLDGVVYRLDGIDAPQTDQTCLDDKGAVWRCGIDARDRLQEKAKSGDVRCTGGGTDSVHRKRRVGECFVGSDSTSLNQWMVQQGWALNLDHSAKGRFKSDRDAASANRNGLWKGCFVAPEALRRFTISTATLLGAGCPKPAPWKVRETLFPDYPAMPAGCEIKSKVVLRSQVLGYNGIYHLKSCRSYARTTPVHRWFCSEEEAQAAGFRKSYTC